MIISVQFEYAATNGYKLQIKDWLRAITNVF